MKKRLLMGLLSAATLMCSCSSGGIKSQTSGTVDCYSIKVQNGGSTVFSETYSSTYASVHEYQNSIGESVYANFSYGKESKIRIYKNRYTSQYDEYSYVNTIGLLTREYNYYLDLDNRIIDSEIKYSEYLYENEQSPYASIEYNNKKAWQCAKKSYYKSSTVYLDMLENPLETHEYTKLGDDCVITYKAKWF